MKRTCLVRSLFRKVDPTTFALTPIGAEPKMALVDDGLPTRSGKGLPRVHSKDHSRDERIVSIMDPDDACLDAGGAIAAPRRFCR